MNNFDNEDFVPELKPTENVEKPKLSLRSEGPKVEGQKKCPHCERMILETARVCPQCGFDTISGKTQQQRNKKGAPIKTIATITVLGALACAGYIFKDEIKNTISKPDAEGFVIILDQDNNVTEPSVNENAVVKRDNENSEVDTSNTITTSSGEAIVLDGDLSEMLESINDEILTLKDERASILSEISNEKLNASEVNKNLAAKEKKLNAIKTRFARIRKDPKAKRELIDRAKDAYSSVLDEVKSLRDESKEYANKLNELENQLKPINKSLKEKEEVSSKLKKIIGKSPADSE